jgi:hypothetical protein
VTPLEKEILDQRRAAFLRDPSSALDLDQFKRRVGEMRRWRQSGKVLATEALGDKFPPVPTVLGIGSFRFHFYSMSETSQHMSTSALLRARASSGWIRLSDWLATEEYGLMISAASSSWYLSTESF